MRRLLVVVLALCVAGAVFAATAPTSNKLSLVGKGTYNGDGAMGPRVGGDVIPGATITALPYNDTGATCGFVNNYDEVCPYTGSTSPDVVYNYTPTADGNICVDLCNSQYDTKLYIYAGGVGNLVACNDDFGCGYSGWQSRVENVPVSAGVTYYIIVDGYGGACGTYVLSVATCGGPCDVVCPAGGVPEGEPLCGDNYYDAYNGGCNSVGFQPLEAANCGCVDLCGKSGTYLYQGLSYRDTDWFLIHGCGGMVTATLTAEFNVQFIFIYVTDCNNLQYLITTSTPCVPAVLSYNLTAGQAAWLWVGASVFSGVPCTSDYLLNVCNIQGQPTPVQNSNWGAIKNLYR